MKSLLALARLIDALTERVGRIDRVEFESRRELLKDYSTKLKKALAGYRATTQPAGGDGK